METFIYYRNLIFIGKIGNGAGIIGGGGIITGPGAGPAIIGIGAGVDVDGQVLVLHDMLGMTHEFNPRFLRRYLNLYDDIGNAIKQYDKDVKKGKFPDSSEEY